MTGECMVVRKNGVQAFPWTAYCLHCELPAVHLVLGVGGVGVNTAIGNRTRELAMMAVAEHIKWHHRTDWKRK